MSLKKIVMFLMVFSLVGFTTAQEEGKIVHDLVFQAGSLDLDENADHFMSVMSEILTKQNAGINAQLVSIDLYGEAYRISETMHLNKYFALEGAIAFLGESKITFDTYEGTLEDVENGEVETSSQELVAQYETYELFAMGKYPVLKDHLVLYGKVGGTFSRAEYSQNPGDGNHDVNAGAVAFGAGAYSVINQSLIIKLDYVSSTADEIDYTTTSLGLGFRF